MNVSLISPTTESVAQPANTGPWQPALTYTLIRDDSKLKQYSYKSDYNTNKKKSL